MDISTLLPLIMSSGGMNKGEGNNSSRLSSMLAAMNGTNSASNDTASLIASLIGKNGEQTSGNANLMNLLTLANKSRAESRRPMGFKPIKDIIPNDLLGIMIKLLINK